MKVRKLLFLTVFISGLTVSAQNALNFDGLNDFVQTTFPGISGNSARTVEAWIRTTANCDPGQGGVQKVILDWGAISPNGSRFTFNVLWSNAIRLEVAGSGVSGTIAVNDGLWHHVAGVYDPLAANKFSLYVDGVLDVSGNNTTAVNTLSTIPLRIGQRVDGINHFDGNIDEVRVWNYARSQAQIVADKSKEFCTIPTGLFAYYKFNQGVASGNNSGLTTLYDASGSNNNGLLNNFALSGIASNWVAGASLLGNTTATISPTACISYMSPAGNIYNTSGIYHDTLNNSIGCDSIITISLTIKPVNISVSLSGVTLTSAAGNATWQWLNCNNNFSVIPGAVNQSYTATVNGNYAVQATQDGCIDTSACYPVTTVGITTNLPEAELFIYPNPSDGIINIRSNCVWKNVILKVVGISGNLLIENRIAEGNQYRIDLSDQPKGIYFIEMKTEEGIVRQKITLL